MTTSKNEQFNYDDNHWSYRIEVDVRFDQYTIFRQSYILIDVIIIIIKMIKMNIYACYTYFCNRHTGFNSVWPFFQDPVDLDKRWKKKLNDKLKYYYKRETINKKKINNIHAYTFIYDARARGTYIINSKRFKFINHSNPNTHIERT